MKEDNNKNELVPEENLKDKLSEEQLKKKVSKISETWLYQLFVKSAYRLLKKPLAVLKILKDAVNYIRKYDSVSDFTEDAKEKTGIIIRMLRAYSKGEYTDISKLNIAMTLGAILYLIAPIDLIPDFLPLGLVDDVALLLWVFNNTKKEVEEFLLWEDSQKEFRIEIEPIVEEEEDEND